MTRSFLTQLWDRLQSSYWFLPLVAAILAFSSARLLFAFDNIVDTSEMQFHGLVYSGTAAEMRSAMVTLAATILTTTGIVYTLVALPFSVVASQFGSRLLRVYLRDRTTQTALAIFTGTFVYCLTLGLAIPPASVEPEPPVISATFAMVLTMSCFASLVILIHHVGVTLQAPSIVAAASSELQAVVQNVINQSKREMEIGDKEVTHNITERIEEEGVPIYSKRMGYVQFLDIERLLPFTAGRDIVLRMVRNPGDFVEPKELLGYAWPKAHVNDAYLERVRRCYAIGNVRVPVQDIEYAITQVTEVGVRALSPAINDPLTAMTSLDHLAAGLGLYAEKVMDHSAYYDANDKLRVIYSPNNFAEIIEVAFTLPRLALGNNTRVYLHFARTIAYIAARTTLSDRLSILDDQVALLESQARASAMIPEDRRAVLAACQAVHKSIQKRLEIAEPDRQVNHRNFASFNYPRKAQEEADKPLVDVAPPDEAEAPDIDEEPKTNSDEVTSAVDANAIGARDAGARDAGARDAGARDIDASTADLEPESEISPPQ